MAGTIVVDRIESDASYASTINVAGQITFSNTVNFGAYSGTAPVAGFYLPSTNNLAFTTASTERMRIDSSGNLLLGATSNTAAPTGYISAANTFGFKNRIINGAMQIWQRGTTFADTTTYTADRWFVNRNGGGTGVTVSRSGTNASNYYFKIQRQAGNTSTLNFDMRQVIETLNCADLAGQTVTISLTAYAGSNWSAGSFSLGYQYSTAVDDNVNVSGSWVTVSGATITPTTTPTVYSYTFTVPANTLTLMLRIFGNPYVGTAGADDSLYIKNIQLEKGSAVTSFDYRPYSTELALCQRYYSKSYNHDVVPGTATTVGLEVCGWQGPGGAGGAYGNVKFPVKMRTTPATINIWDGAGTATTTNSYTYGMGGSAQSISNGGAWWGSGTPFNTSHSGFFMRPTSTQPNALTYCHYAADAEL